MSLNPVKLIKKEPVKKFEIIEESPNLKIKIFGKSPREIFHNALYAMAYVQSPSLIEPSTVDKLISAFRGKKLAEEIVIEGMDYQTLLIDFLEQALELSDEKNFLFFEPKFNEFSEQKLVGRLIGVKFENLERPIKDINYENIDVKEVEPGKWEAIIVFEL